MPYELDSTTESNGGESAETDDDRHTPGESGAPTDPDADGTEGERRDSLGESLGVSIPDEHVGAFVAEVFEDPERSTSWGETVDAMVAPDAREEWESLSPREQATEMLSAAETYDERAIDGLESVPLDGDPDVVPASVREALRCRRNADAFRNAVADAYADGRLGDDDLIAAVDDAGFETAAVARREDLLERVDGVYDVEFRPYGGTLMDADDGPDPDVDHDANEAW